MQELGIAIFLLICLESITIITIASTHFNKLEWKKDRARRCFKFFAALTAPLEPLVIYLNARILYFVWASNGYYRYLHDNLVIDWKKKTSEIIVQPSLMDFF